MDNIIEATIMDTLSGNPPATPVGGLWYSSTNGINIPVNSSTYTIRGTDNGFSYEDVMGYISAVNSGTVEPYYRGSATTTYMPNVPELVPNDYFGIDYGTNLSVTHWSAISNNCIIWNTTRGQIHTQVDANGLFSVTANKRLTVKSGLVIINKSRAVPLPKNIPENERVAMETLREEVSESEFRRYLKYGFILVKGLSGDTYQIFRNQSHTKIWRGGTLVEEVCVRLSDRSIPSTDNVIAFKNIIQCSEDEFKNLGNVYRNMARVA